MSYYNHCSYVSFVLYSIWHSFWLMLFSALKLYPLRLLVTDWYRVFRLLKLLLYWRIDHETKPLAVQRQFRLCKLLPRFFSGSPGNLTSAHQHGILPPGWTSLHYNCASTTVVLPIYKRRTHSWILQLIPFIDTITRLRRWSNPPNSEVSSPIVPRFRVHLASLQAIEKRPLHSG